MKYVYPAIFTREDDAVLVRFPDIPNCFTDGKDAAEALFMAQDALCLLLYSMEEKGESPAPSSDIATLKVAQHQFVSLVDCDTTEYRRFFEGKAIKKTVSLPAWLSSRAEKENISLSQVLQDALREKLNLQ